MANEIIYKARPLVAGVDVKVIDTEARVLRFVISTEMRDRDGDIVRQRGIDLGNYQKNPVVFYGHNSFALPIARSIKVRKEKSEGGWITSADALFAGHEQGHGEAELVYALARDGFINTASIGFGIRAIKDLPDAALTDEERANRKAGQGVRGVDITASELYEWSPVGIPSNVGAEIQRNGLVASPDWPVARVMDVARNYLKGSVLDDFRRALVGREVIHVGTLDAAKAPAHVRALMSAEPSTGGEDMGFDDSAKWLAAPAETKAPEPEPEPEDDDPPVAPVVSEKAAPAPVEKLTDAEAGAMEARLGMLAGSLGALIARAESVLGTVETACARMEACCADMEAEDVGEEPSGPSDSYAEMSAHVEALKRHFDDVLVDLWGRTEDEKSHIRKSASKTVAVIPAAAPVDAKPAGAANTAEAAKRLAALETKLDKFFGVYAPTGRSAR